MLAGWEDEQNVRRAIAALPLEFREILVLRHQENLSYKEIADIAGIPPGTVMLRLARARSRLKELLTMTRHGGADLMKNCEETRAWSDAYLDGELDPINNLEIERHLENCPTCAQAFAEERALAAAIRSPGLRYQAPADMRTQIHAALRTEIRGENAAADVVAFPAAQTQRWGWRSLAAVAAGLVILLSVGFVYFQRGPGKR